VTEALTDPCHGACELAGGAAAVEAGVVRQRDLPPLPAVTETQAPGLWVWRTLAVMGVTPTHKVVCGFRDPDRLHHVAHLLAQTASLDQRQIRGRQTGGSSSDGYEINFR